MIQIKATLKLEKFNFAYFCEEILEITLMTKEALQ